MRIINASETGTLVLGYQGEDQRLVVRFPLVDEKSGQKITDEFPGGSFTVSIILPDDPAEHIVGNEDLQLTDDALLWTVKEPYTVGHGEGRVQLNYAFSGMAKSKVWKTNVRKSINSGSGTVPSWSDWKTELLNAANAVEQAVESYDEMTAEAEELPAGSTPTAEMDHTGDHPVLKLGIPASQGGGGGDVQSVNGKTGVVVLNANDVGALPSSTPIPPAVTVDSELSGTSTNPVQNKVIAAALNSQSETIVNLSNAVSGKYAKPSGGIPSTDMSQAVQTSLGKADTAIQEHQDISGKQNKPATAGTAGQVLGLDGSLNPVWKTQYPQSYEVIADITLEEDTEDLVINKFSDNSPLLISDFILECNFKAAPSSSYLGAFFKDSNGVTQYMPTGQMLTDSDKTTYYWTERYGDFVRMYANRPHGWDETTYDEPYYYNILYNSPTIREINLYKYSSSAQPIPAGSRIRLLGVRA